MLHPPVTPVQPTFEDVGTPLSRVTFVVLDLETTGGTPATAGITEVGAVKVRGGEVLGELQTLVDPGTPVPAFIATLTGITTSMVRGAPRIEQVLPSLLEFLRGTVLVAHNAAFDVGFLRAAAAEHGYAWPDVQVLDTVALARRAVTRDEVPNHKLGTLAAYFRATVTPDHRALSDARATVDVLHALLARLAPLGITHLEDLATATDPVPPARRRKRHLADGLPDAPGVYQFRDARGEVLYVGVSTSIRTRVRSYFTAAEHRRRMNEMVAVAEQVVPIVCGTVLEARVRELRLIAEHAPRYNRRSRAPERMPWVRLTSEPFPRLTVTRQVRHDGPAGAPPPAFIGPFPSRAAALQAVDALHATFALRQCAARLPRTPSPTASACALAGMGRCGAPCTGAQDVDAYAAVVAQVRAAMVLDPSPVLEVHAARIAALTAAERFEEAAAWRDRLRVFVRGAARAQRSARLGGHRQLVAARRDAGGGWEVVVVRHGRLCASTVTPAGADPRPAIEALLATAEEVTPAPAPATAAHPEESDLVLRWLEEPGVRLVDLAEDDSWACPVRGAEAFQDDAATAAAVAQARDRLVAGPVTGSPVGSETVGSETVRDEAARDEAPARDTPRPARAEVGGTATLGAA